MSNHVVKNRKIMERQFYLCREYRRKWRKRNTIEIRA
ncbi:MAG: hypothetical protein MjAS7_2131 [Metallosphaera javensis (ex Sakai et al. 2022)]|nr:MAG: hypothetical protein MjAS7_2131 [Metallosphaera javensis (ex Sakai et al. 2022)]